MGWSSSVLDAALNQLSHGPVFTLPGDTSPLPVFEELVEQRLAERRSQVFIGNRYAAYGYYLKR